MRKHRTVIAVVCIALWMPVVLTLASLFGCNTTDGTPPYPLTDASYQTATNVIVGVAQAAHASGIAPWASMIEALAAAILALLAGWQGLTHNRVVELEKLVTQKLPPPTP